MKCRVCQEPSPSPAPLKVKGARQAYSHSFEYTVCVKCGSLSISNIPENLSEFYKNYYSFQNFEPTSSFIDKLKKILLKILFLKTCPSFLKRVALRFFFTKEDDFKLTSLIPVCPQKDWRILDIGSGSGDFVCNLHDLGFKNAIGIDPFLEKSIQYSNGALILKQDLSSLCEKFDLITFHHSFEHLENPQHYLEKLKTLLNPDGICILRLPNIECLSFKIFKEFWVGIHAPYHVFLPTYRGLDLLLKPLGLEIQSCLGEQVIDFFLISMENFMSIPDHDKDSIRSLLKRGGHLSETPWHCKQELCYWKSMKKLVEKNNLCDCVVYYIGSKNG